MKRFIQGEDRTQSTLLHDVLDNYVTEANPVRVVDVYVDELDLGKLGFEGMDPAATDRPAYHPAVLLNIYIYGYLNRIQSNRRLEREAQRNAKWMWLTGRLMPDFKTIANLRKDKARQSAVSANSSLLYASSSVSMPSSLVVMNKFTCVLDAENIRSRLAKTSLN